MVYSAFSTTPPDSSLAYTGFILYIVSFGILIGSEINSVVHAINYGKEYNNKLREGLNISYNYEDNSKFICGLFEHSDKKENVFYINLLSIPF